MNPTAAWFIERAIHGAADRLEQPTCARALDDFADADGTPLAIVLQRTGLSPRAFLQTRYFIDGGDTPACRDNDTRWAYTVPGTKAILVCAERFERHNRHRPRAGEMLVIHELLHALGLGENPPASAAIAAKVRDRCLSGSADRRSPSAAGES